MEEGGAIAALMAMLAGMMFILMLPMLIMIIAMWKVFTKAGKPGWAVIIPIYANIVMLEIIGQPWTRLLWYLIPIYGLYLAIVDLNTLSRSFGKDTGFTVGLILLGPVFWCILGFGSAQYLGPGGTGQQPVYQSQTPMPIMATDNLRMHFPVKGGVFRRAVAACKAVDGVSLAIQPGETLGLVGESGCGKSTLGKTMARLYKPTGGGVRFEGNELGGLSRGELKPFRREIQMIFQDPYESLNPRQTVASIIEEPFIIHKMGTRNDRREWVAGLLEQVGLPSVAAQRYPFEFSGGQRQRIGIARALALKPKLLICDEPVSALDVSIQSQILNLLMDLQRELNLSYLFISHDLAVVKHISDRIAVMYLGRIVELAPAEEIYSNPLHAYTKALISAIPVPDPTVVPDRVILEGDVPSPIDPPDGCRFAPRSGVEHSADALENLAPFAEVAPKHWVEACPHCVDLLSV